MPGPLTVQNGSAKSSAQSKFKKGIDASDARKNRADTRVSVRKDKREEAMKKKRRDQAGGTAAISTPGMDALTSAAGATANVSERVRTRR